LTSGRCDTLVTRLGDKVIGDDGRRATGEEEEVEREAVARSKKEQKDN